MILFVSKDLETIMHQRYKILLTPKRHPIVCVYGKYIKKKSNNWQHVCKEANIGIGDNILLLCSTCWIMGCFKKEDLKDYFYY